MLSEIKYINTEEIIINFNSEVAGRAILNFKRGELMAVIKILSDI